MRRAIVATMLAGLAIAGPAAMTASAQPVIPPELCMDGGGEVVETGRPPTGFNCIGGRFNGWPVAP
ncbi:hypothetical protein [Saccharopolyspora taberi]|uniref:Uncharacterized protein n=1 Tax=Saccharopolyspora taberi TaxID=60895 RepID=A0ABN3VLZ4_9PSEU